MTQTAMVGALPELLIAFPFVVEEENSGSSAGGGLTLELTEKQSGRRSRSLRLFVRVERVVRHQGFL